MKRTTIKDIANHLCLSVSTVSRGLANDKNIRRETREMITAAANELGYQRNIYAASLRRGRSNMIGVIANQMITPGASIVLKGIQTVAQSHGISVLLCNSDNSAQQELRNLHMLENAMVDGIIIGMCHDDCNFDEYRRIQEKGIPMVFYQYSPLGQDVASVGVNAYDKAFYLLDHLVCEGRRRIVNISGPRHTNEIIAVDRAYEDVMRKFGIVRDKSLQFNADCISISEGERIADSLLDNGVDFDAVFAPCELMAVGVLNRLRARNVSVPQKVSVAAFSGSPFSKLVTPKLTIVEPGLEEMGEKSMALLLDMLTQNTYAPKKVVIDAQIKLRESTHVSRV